MGRRDQHGHYRQAASPETHVILQRKAPSGLVTAASRGSYRYYRPLDNACACLEAEDLRRDYSSFDGGLLAQMEWRGIGYLRLHYPELTFGFVEGSKQPAADYARRAKGGWVVANWRTA